MATSVGLGFTDDFLVALLTMLFILQTAATTTAGISGAI
jgi:hypothetical protein